MANSNKPNDTRIYAAALPTSSGTLYTQPARPATETQKGVTSLQQIIITNTTAGALTVTLNLVPNGGSAIAMLSAVSFAANTVTIYNVDVPLFEGDALTGLASGAGVNAFINGTYVE